MRLKMDDKIRLANEFNVIEKVREFVEEECKKPGAKYDYDLVVFHLIPVVKYSLKLAEKLNADREIVELAAWLHDIGSVIYGRENHHVTGIEVAEQKLKEFGYPQEKIEKIKECIKTHRGSQAIVPETTEARIIAEADAMSHFDTLPGLFRACYCFENKKSQGEARDSVKQKLKNSYNKLSKEAKEIIYPKYKAAMLLLGGE
jgi:uncharacterized protein